MKLRIFAPFVFCVIIGIAGCGGQDNKVSSGGATENDTALLSDSAPANLESLNLTQGEPGAAAIIDAGRYTDAARPPGAPPPNGAAADGTMNSYYTPGKAFDGNFNTWWVGTSGRGQWDLYYGFATSTRVDQISVTFYNASYVPSTIVLKTSVDGTTWTTVGTMPAANANPYINVNANIRYYWIQMDGNPAMGFPLVRDVKCLPNLAGYGSTAGPGFDDAMHGAANAFDGNNNTGWAGAVNAGKWDLYYKYASPQTIQTLTATMFNLNYRPATMTLYTSADASTWTEIGQLGPGSSPSIYVGASVTYLRLEMTGNPLSKFPYIKEISYTQPSGASSGDERSGFYKASNAFDGDPNTLWVGDSAKSEWNLFMNYPAPRYIQSVSVAYPAANAIPATTTLFCSSDAISWTQNGTFARTATSTLTPNASCKHLRFKMTKSGGYPTGGFPVIKDISFVSSVCGNSAIETGETCDDGNAITETCAYGQTSCAICNASCQSAAGTTSYCGNGAINAGNGETCDDGNTITETCAYGQASCVICNAACNSVAGSVIGYCGDSVIQNGNGEICDDGNMTSGDGCSSACQSDAQATNAWITIPAGNFVMGCATGDAYCYSKESPKHTVYMPQYKIHKYMVTNIQYKACVSAGVCSAPTLNSATWRSDYYTNSLYNNYAVVNVTWFMANAYCVWIGGHLPTEAEWEKAARGPSPRENIFPWGNNPPNCSVVNFLSDTSLMGDKCVFDNTAVDRYPLGASYYGVLSISSHDLGEWMNDWYLSTYYTSGGPTWSNPQGPATGTSRSIRNASTGVGSDASRISYRNGIPPANSYGNFGFRCAHN